MSRFWNIQNATDAGRAEITLYGNIGRWSDIDERYFLQEYNQVKDKDLDVFVNSGGGSVFTALSIYNILSRHAKQLTFYIDGIAASAMTIITSVPNAKVIMPLGTMFMIHDPLLDPGMSNAKELREIADLLDKVGMNIADIYKQKTGMDDQLILDLMSKDTYMTATEALDYGFIDEIGQQLDVAASISRDKMVVNGIELDPSKHKNMPENWFTVKNQAQEPVNNPATPDNSKIEGEKPMNLEELKAKHPDLYNQIKNEGVKAGEEQERARIKNIEDMAMPGYEQLVNKAKFETPMEANALAVEIIKAQKEKGNKFLAQRQQDSQDLADIQDGVEVPNTVATTAEQDAAELKRLAAIAAKAANGKRNIK